MNDRSLRRNGAFTLIELLVVIAIIGVLAGMLFPVVSSIMEKGNSTKCTANLRQIGMAIISYTGDNADTLPGPLTMGQMPMYKSTDIGSLPKLLAKYLNLTENTGSVSLDALNKANVFVCPSNHKSFPAYNGIVYAMNMRPVVAYNQSPWGDSASAQQPLRKAILSGWTDSIGGNNDAQVELAQTFAMRDTDQQDSEYKVTSTMSSTALAATPVHGDHRNALYYDFHVAQMILTDQTSNWVPAPQ
jgi:prepilin-type N-terminal cleavage/methylation domain-containing protein